MNLQVTHLRCDRTKTRKKIAGTTEEEDTSKNKHNGEERYHSREDNECDGGGRHSREDEYDGGERHGREDNEYDGGERRGRKDEYDGGGRHVKEDNKHDRRERYGRES